jgi:hypothetical protein
MQALLLLLDNRVHLKVCRITQGCGYTRLEPYPCSSIE